MPVPASCGQEGAMRTFVAVLCAAFAGLAVIGAMSSVASHDSGDAMFLGLLGGAAAMGAALAFRRPTEAERLARQAKRDATREARLARRRQRDPRHWEKRIAVALLIAIGAVIASAVLTKHDRFDAAPAKPAQDRFPATNIEVLGDRVKCDVRYQELKLPPA